ncbi:MAG: hypothetical protein A2958_03325 [Candidatus Levybacteria bacterium RIFCSPLOWO2_01_FULL_38_13]|nr:MAG: hypothetical protein A2958_03325 [Candidatus Levybacteria bacterium RIFCSPLOWO2_01_FULL_38_13]
MAIMAKEIVNINVLKVLIIVCLVSFVFGELIRFSIFGIETKLLDLTVALTFGFWLIYSFLKKRISKTIYAPALIFSIYCLWTLLINLKFLDLNQGIVSFAYLLRWVGYASLFTIVSSFDREFKDTIKSYLIFIGAIIVTAGFIQFTFYQSLRNLFYLGWDEHLYRMFSVFLDPNFAGAFFVLYFLFLLDLIFENLKNKKKLLIYSFLSVCTFLAILLTYSRSAFIMLIVGAVMFFILKRRPIYIVILVFLFVVLTFLLPKAYKTEGTNFLRIVSSEARFDSARLAFNIFKDNPVFGVGFNSYKFARQRYGSKISVTSHADATTDNSYLFILATTGIIGLILYLSIWYKLIKSNKKLSLFIPSTVSIFVGSLFINGLFYSFIMFWVWIVAGIMDNNE